MKLRYRIVIGIVMAVLFALTTLVFALFDAGLNWENLATNYVFIDWLSLIFYRLLIYIFLALIFAVIIFKRAGIGYKETLKEVFICQFTVYAIIKVVWELFSLNYLWSTEIFDNLDSFIILAGLLLSIIFKKKTKVESSL